MSDKKEWAVINPDMPEEAKEILKTKFKVYEDPILEKGTVLTGKKGKDVRQDVVYAPYVPLQVTPTTLDSRTKKHPTEEFTEEVAKGEIAEIVGAALRAADEIDPALKPYITKAWRATAERCFGDGSKRRIHIDFATKFGKPGINRPPTPEFDPSDFSLRKGIRDRYAKKVVNPKFFGTVNVNNL